MYLYYEAEDIQLRCMLVGFHINIALADAIATLIWEANGN